MTDLAGKVALITGAAQGQGEAEAELFIERGAKVVVTDILDGDGQAVADRIGANASFVHLDVSDEAGWAKAVEYTVSTYGGVDILINNAAAFDEMTPMAELDMKHWQHVVDVNQTGVLLGMRAVFQSMVGRGGGSIINIASLAATHGSPMMVPYTATKFAVVGLTRVAAAEWGKHGIRVNVIYPGSIATDAHVARALRRPARPINIPLGRKGKPSEIAELACFLASDRSSYLSGGDFVCDGGRMANVLGRPTGPELG